MACRPAGLSEDDTGDDEEAYNNKGPNKKQSSRSSNDCTPDDDKEQLEFSAVCACMAGNLDGVLEYINAGRNVNDFLHTGWTLLLYAASSNVPEVLKLLIRHGAKANKNKDGYSPLMALCESTTGSEQRCLASITILVEAKANPNSRSKLMKTPLMFACSSRGAMVVEELLKHVKDIDAVDSDGRTALHYAVMANKLETVKILLKNNASRKIMDRRDLTAADIAATKDYDGITAILNFDELDRDLDDSCQCAKITAWIDMFEKDLAEFINPDVAAILGGMGLDCYKPLFKGMELKNFLKLVEYDLVELGMDIAVHRKQFIENLHRLHAKAWSLGSIGSIDNNLPYTLYNSVVLLGNVARQIRVIGSSFRFIKNGLRKVSSVHGKSTLSDFEKAEYNGEFIKTEETLLLLKEDVCRMTRLANKVEKVNRGIKPASHISPGLERTTDKYKWTIICGIVLISGMYLSKTACVQKLLCK